MQREVDELQQILRFVGRRALVEEGHVGVLHVLDAERDQPETQPDADERDDRRATQQRDADPEVDACDEQPADAHLGDEARARVRAELQQQRGGEADQRGAAQDLEEPALGERVIAAQLGDPAGAQRVDLHGGGRHRDRAGGHPHRARRRVAREHGPEGHARAGDIGRLRRPRDAPPAHQPGWLHAAQRRQQRGDEGADDGLARVVRQVAISQQRGREHQGAEGVLLAL